MCEKKCSNCKYAVERVIVINQTITELECHWGPPCIAGVRDRGPLYVYDRYSRPDPREGCFRWEAKNES